LILSRAEIPFLGLMRRYIFVTPLQDRSSFSRKTLPTDPVAPVRKIVFPSKYSGIDIIQQEPTTLMVLINKTAEPNCHKMQHPYLYTLVF
jgi:hypothetical protein